jgi:FO synthase
VLAGGSNDLGGTLMEETISRMAGSQHGSRKSVGELEELATGIGRPVRQRTTTYGEVPAERQALARHPVGVGVGNDPRQPLPIVEVGARTREAS